MAIIVLYTDLRKDPSQLEKLVVEWMPDLTARQAIAMCLGESIAEMIEQDLSDNNHELIVSCWHKPSGNVSEIGGVGTTLWKVKNGSVISISYENENTTQAQIDESIELRLNKISSKQPI